MMLESFSGRMRIAEKLLSVKQSVAQAITDDFFLNHADLAVRYGEDGRQFCAADVCFHVEFLAGAIEADSPQAFADYARWTARMLGARGVGAHTLEESLDQLEDGLAAVLLPEEHDAVSKFMAQGRKARAEPELASDAEPPDNGLGVTRQLFLTAILGGERHAALKIIEEALREGHSHVDIYVDVFAESLHRVGELWEMNKVTIAQGHVATSITQYAIASVYPKLVPSAVHRGNMVVTGVSGEFHQIGANLVADSMEASGWTVRFLGTDLPHFSILSTVEEISADVLCISTTILANLPSVAELVRAIRSKLGKRAPKIVLGGSAYRRATQFAREVGAADAVIDLRQGLMLLGS